LHTEEYAIQAWQHTELLQEVCIDLLPEESITAIHVKCCGGGLGVEQVGELIKLKLITLIKITDSNIKCDLLRT